MRNRNYISAIGIYWVIGNWVIGLFPVQRRFILLAQDRVSSFGNRRIKACLAAPRRYRRLHRPSSACFSKASAVCIIETTFGYTLIFRKRKIGRYIQPASNCAMSRASNEGKANGKMRRDNLMAYFIPTKGRNIPNTYSNLKLNKYSITMSRCEYIEHRNRQLVIGNPFINE